MPLDADLAAPCQHGVAGEFRPIVADDHAGLPRRSISAVSSRTTRRPEIDVSGTAARHSLVTSSTTLSTRNRLPDAIWSCTKSRLQRWFGNARTGAGALVPTARLRLRRRLSIWISWSRKRLYTLPRRAGPSRHCGSEAAHRARHNRCRYRNRPAERRVRDIMLPADLVKRNV